MSMPNTGSPSPPPEAPIASTPGPRATALQKIFASALTASIKANSYANFSSCFPTPARHVPDALENLWLQVNTRLAEVSTRQFEQILEEKQVVESLNQWERLIDEARMRRDRGVEGEMPPKPLHTLSAEELYTAHLTPYLQEATRDLEVRIQKSQEENATVIHQISEQRAEIEKLLDGLEHVVKDIEESVDTMRSSQPQTSDGWRDDVWQLEQQTAAMR